MTSFPPSGIVVMETSLVVVVDHFTVELKSKISKSIKYPTIRVWHMLSQVPLKDVKRQVSPYLEFQVQLGTQ